MSSEGESSGTSTGKKFVLFAVMGLLAVIVVIYALYPESTIKKVKIPGVFEAEFERKLTPDEKIQEIPKAELAQRQQDLEKKLRQTETNVEEDRGQPPAAWNINGTWRAPGGILYVMQQSGHMVAFREMNPVYGVTAVGQGAINGQDLDISYTTIMGTTGRTLLKVSPDGQQLTGSFTDMSTGASGPVALYR